MDNEECQNSPRASVVFLNMERETSSDVWASFRITRIPGLKQISINNSCTHFNHYSDAASRAFRNNCCYCVSNHLGMRLQTGQVNGLTGTINHPFSNHIIAVYKVINTGGLKPTQLMQKNKYQGQGNQSGAGIWKSIKE